MIRKQWGMPLGVAVVGLLWAASTSQAAHCGCTSFPSGGHPCDAQCCFNAAQQQTRTSYRLVWDNVLEKRFHVCHQTVCERSMKPVCKTCVRIEQRTCYNECQETAWRTEQMNVTRPVYRTVL